MSKMLKSRLGGFLFLVAGMFLGAVPGANAATLNIPELGSFAVSPIVLPEATIRNLENSTLATGAAGFGIANGFCFTNPAINCKSDGEIVFTNPVTNLTFNTAGAHFGGSDSVSISAFDGAAGLLAMLTVTTDGLVDLSGAGAITRLFFDDNSADRGGLGYHGFSFNVAPPMAAVPLPAALPLLAGGLGLMGLVGWRRKRIAAAT